MASLRDLPYQPSLNHFEEDELVRSVYVKERRAIKSEEELATFVKRWGALWGLNGRYMQPQSLEEASLCNGIFDVKQTMICITAITTPDGECEHVGGCTSCCAMHICTPAIFMFADILAQKYGVTPDLALIQICGELEHFV